MSAPSRRASAATRPYPITVPDSGGRLFPLPPAMASIARRSIHPGAMPLLPAVAGSAAAVLGVALLFGWKTDALGWLRLTPELALTPAKVAVGLILGGTSLLALHRGLRILPALLGGGLLAYSLWLLGQSLFGLGSTLDAVLFGLTPPPMSAPDGFAVTVAASFALSGIASLLVRRHGFTSALLGSAILVVGAVACFGYAVDLPRAFGWNSQSRLPLVVGFGLLLQGAGMVVHALQTDWRAGRPSGWWKSVMVGGTAVVAGVLVWQGLRAREMAHVESLVYATAQGVRGELEGRMRLIADALTRLGKHGAKVGWHSREDWQTDARLVFGEIRGFETMEWIDGEFVSRLLATAQETPRPLAQTPEADSLRAQSLQAVRRSGKPVTAGPFPFEDGTAAFRVLVPLTSGGHIYAYMSGVFSAEGAFAALAENVAPGYSLQVLCQGREVFRVGEVSHLTEGPFMEKLLVDLPGVVPWWIAMAPRRELAATLNTPLPEVALGASLLLAFLLTLAVRIGEMAALRAEYFETAVRDRTAELEESMSALRSEISERRRSEDALRRTQTISRQMSAELDVGKLVQAVTDAARDLTGAACAAFVAAPRSDEGPTLQHTFSPPADTRDQCLLRHLERSALLRATLAGQEIVRRADARKDPRFPVAAVSPGGADGADGGQPGAEDPTTLVSYLAAPVVSRTGEVWGALLLGHPRPGVFTQREEEIVTALAAQAAIAMDNAQLYEDERAASAQAKAASEAKDVYIHMLGHELRNPLGSISNALEVITLRPEDAGTQKRMRTILERQVARLSRVIDDLLEVSRIASGKTTLRLERGDLTILTRDAAELVRPRVESAGLVLEYEVPATPVWVDVDPLRFAQVFDNLVANSINFTDPGGRVDVELRVDEPAGQALLSVMDTGCGIEPDQLERIFEPFVQTADAQQRRTGGLGLGLAIVKGMMEAHGGSVALHSEGRGRGCEVELRFPLRDRAAPSVVRPAAAEPAAGQRILVIDDHRDSADGLREMLELYGHQVAVAYDGPTGLAAAKSMCPDVVICDIGLPGLDGYAVARELRRDPTTAGARLLALTGYGDESTTQQVVTAGFESHLTKPIEPAVLRRLLAVSAPAGNSGRHRKHSA